MSYKCLKEKAKGFQRNLALLKAPTHCGISAVLYILMDLIKFTYQSSAEFWSWLRTHRCYSPITFSMLHPPWCCHDNRHIPLHILSPSSLFECVLFIYHLVLMSCWPLCQFMLHSLWLVNKCSSNQCTLTRYTIFGCKAVTASNFSSMTPLWFWL